MKINVFNIFLSRLGGGIFFVIEELYKKNNTDIVFWGYRDNYSETDSKRLNGKIHTFYKKNFFYFSKSHRDKVAEHLKKSQQEFNIFHLHSLWTFQSLIFMGLKGNIKRVISTHGMLDVWALNNNKIKKKIALFLFEKRNLTKCDCIHALCFEEYNSVRKIVKNTPIAIIPNGVTIPEDFVKKTENTGESKKLLFFGRLHPKKGLLNLIDAWGKSNHDNWELIICGPDENNFKRKLEKKVDTLNVKNISIVDGKYGEEKVRIFKEASAFILPSFSEGLPMSVLEAWSFKLPALITKECNLHDSLKNQIAIEISTSVDGIVNGISTLAKKTDEDLLELGEKSYDYVKSNFSWDIVRNQMKDLYKWLNSEIDKPDFVHEK